LAATAFFLFDGVGRIYLEKRRRLRVAYRWEEISHMSRKNAILTYTNTLFYPLDPRAEEIHIEDIAHALSQMCRANGHFKKFHSVAQHCINCTLEARARHFSERVQLACLLHDASEAYISDITRPVKCYLKEYCRIEHKLQQAIYAKFCLGDMNEAELKEVEAVDNALLYYEFERLHHQGIHKQPPRVFSSPDTSERNMTAVERQFLQLTEQLLEHIASKNR